MTFDIKSFAAFRIHRQGGQVSARFDEIGLADLTAGAQAEFNRMLGQQMAGTSQEMMENFKKMMSVSAMPGNSGDAFAAMQKAFGTAKDAFDQIAKASSTAFTMPGAGKGKSVKVE